MIVRKKKKVFFVYHYFSYDTYFKWGLKQEPTFMKAMVEGLADFVNMTRRISNT